MGEIEELAVLWVFSGGTTKGDRKEAVGVFVDGERGESAIGFAPVLSALGERVSSERIMEVFWERE